MPHRDTAGVTGNRNYATKPETIPADWIRVKKLKRAIQGKVDELIQSDPEFKDVPYYQLVAALSQVAADMAAQQAVETIRDGRKDTGFVFHMPV